MTFELLHHPANSQQEPTSPLDPNQHREIFGVSGEWEPNYYSQEIVMQPDTIYPLTKYVQRGLSFVRDHKAELAVAAVAVAAVSTALITESKLNRPQPQPLT